MLAFYREYPEPASIVPPAAAQWTDTEKAKKNLSKSSVKSKVPQPVAQTVKTILWRIPWAHHVILMDKVPAIGIRLWYMEQVLVNGWSRNVLALQIEAQAHVRQGKARSNFPLTLPEHQSDLVQQTFKDPYLFDFLTMTESFQERELETALVRHLEKFLLELGQGFAFVGRQYRIEVGDEDFYIDLLFYHLRLRAFVVIELKKGKFKPEYAGKLNFYCNVVNDRLKQPADQPTIGLILCQEHSRLMAEYSFAGIDKPIGISTYELTRALPKEVKSALPTVEEIEAELSELTKLIGSEKPRAKKSSGKRARRRRKGAGDGE
jgi:predicted nuclease of restriction endonuclease-like (RecB) superfamily